MRASDILILSTRMFRARALRTGLTILGVSVGIGAIVFLVSLGYGLQAILLEKITTSESLLTLDVFPADEESIILNQESITEIRSIDKVKSVTPLAVAHVQVSIMDSTSDVTGNIVDPAFFMLSGITKPKAGSFYSQQDTEHIVITTTVSDLFGFNYDDIVGQKVSLTIFFESDKSKPNDLGTLEELTNEFIISGVIQNDTLSIFFSPKLFSGYKIQSYSQAKVRVSDSDALEYTRDKLLEQGYTVLALSDIVEQANKIFGALQIILAVFGMTALLVSSIGMFNTMTIAFLERTQEIGIMRALGASESDMAVLFIIESTIMGFLGGVGGIIIGITGQMLVNFGIDVMAKSLGGIPVDLFSTPLWFTAVIIVFSSLVGFLTGLIPGRRASKLNPLQALKYK